MRKTRFALTLAPTLSVVIALLAVAFVATSVFATGPYGNSVTYSGQGISEDVSKTYKLNTEMCGVENGAEREGSYILWVLTATGAGDADITGPWGTAPMTKTGGGNGKDKGKEDKGGTFKYISDWYDLSTLSGNVSATYDGEEKNAQLVISHGCPDPGTKGAWCSPGFWRNAEDAAWERIGVSKGALFNDSVFDEYYGAELGDDPNLETVLTTNGGEYKGAPFPGTKGYDLNAYNATAAFLTDQIPGYQFSWDMMQAEEEDSEIDPCPLDHHGDFK